MHKNQPNGPSVRDRLTRCYGPVLRAVVVVGTLLTGELRAASTGAGDWPIQRIEQGGVAVEFTMTPVDAGSAGRRELREGDDVVFRFRMADTATGSPVTRADPAAWMDLEGPPGGTVPGDCERRVAAFLSASIFNRPELDLNVYYVVALNSDATLTVVDPLFGFGGTQLLALVPLASRGYDWVLTADQQALFVTMPEANRVAMVDPLSWQVATNLDLGAEPGRIALQPDGEYGWVSRDGGENSGVTVFRVRDRSEVARIITGRGRHDLAFSDDSRYAFVTNERDDSVSVIDVRRLACLRTLATGRKPASIAYSPLARAAYVTHEDDGVVAVIDGMRHEVIHLEKAEPGLGRIRFAPGGRLGFVVNSRSNLVHILDASRNRIVQTADTQAEPDQVTFSDKLAYVRHRRSETVLMIPLAEVGQEGKPVPVADFPGGQRAPGATSFSSPAEGIVPVPGGDAVLVANAPDQAVYFYSEGMAAPMGHFGNYRRDPRAVLVVDRRLREGSAPGVYETVGRLCRAGTYSVVLFVRRPKLTQCFSVEVKPRPGATGTDPRSLVRVEAVVPRGTVPVGQPQSLGFRILDAAGGAPIAGLKDVRIMVYLAPGAWHMRESAAAKEAGVYAIDWVPPAEGTYYVHLESRSLGLTFQQTTPAILRAVARESTPASTTTAAAISNRAGTRNNLP